LRAKKAIVEFVNIKREFYRVYYYTEGGSKITCNIFYNQSDESIELDIEEIRKYKENVRYLKKVIFVEINKL
jgi:hypothetical protein